MLIKNYTMMNLTFKQWLKGASFSVLMGSFAISTPSFAQSSDDTSFGLDEVVVTAERRERNIQDIPLAITALSADQLDSQQILTTLDLERAVPNLVTDNNVGLGSSVTYFLRGVGSTESIPTFDLPVGTYIDEVFIARQNANQIGLSGVDRIEVLRGPQGTLFGRNTTGGAVSIVTKKPEFDFGVEAEIGIGNFDRFTVNGAINVPVSDDLAVRLSGLLVQDDGFIENIQNSATFNGEETVGFRGAIRYEPTDAIRWNGSVQWIDTETSGLGTPENVNPDGSSTVEPASGDLLLVNTPDMDCVAEGGAETFTSQGCQFNEAETLLAISNLGIDIPIGTVNFITGYYENDFRFNVDLFGNSPQALGGALGPNFFLSNDTNTEQFSQEVKLTGDLLDGRVSYTTGVFYINEDNETRFLDEVNFGFPLVFNDRDEFINSTESIAFYGQTDIALTDRLKLQLGVRWTEEDKNLEIEGGFLGGGIPLNDEALLAEGIPLDQNVSLVTPRFAAFYDVTDNISAYASYTEGFKSGGWNARGFSALELQAFDRETVESFEVGVRTQLFDNRLRFNATAFNANYDDFQVPSAIEGTANFVTLNSGEARVRGIELDFQAAATDGLQLFGNLGLQDGDYLELSDGAIAAGIGPELQRTPTLSGQLGFTNRWDIQNHGLTLGADVAYTGAHEQNPNNEINGSIDAEALVNAQLAWDLPGDNFKVIAECSNCLDNVFVTQALFNVLFANDPRRFNLRFQYDF